MSTVTTKRPRITQADKARESVGLTVVMMTEQELTRRGAVAPVILLIPPENR